MKGKCLFCRDESERLPLESLGETLLRILESEGRLKGGLSDWMLFENNARTAIEIYRLACKRGFALPEERDRLNALETLNENQVLEAGPLRGGRHRDDRASPLGGGPSVQCGDVQCGGGEHQLGVAGGPTDASRDTGQLRLPFDR